MSNPAAPVAALEGLDGIVVGAADALTCQRWLREVKRVRGFLDAVEAQITARVDALATSGESFGSADTHVNCSGVSAAEAERRRRRSKAIEQAVGFGEALAEGAVSAEHVDALANATARLDDGVRAAVFTRSGELLDRARCETPDRFGRHVRDLARKLERDAGVERDKRQRRDTYMTWKLNQATGMYDIRGSLHPELGGRFVQAISNEVAARVTAGEAAGLTEFVDRTVDRGRLAAEAMVDFVTAGHHMARPVLADITVHVDADTLERGEYHDHSICETGDGALLPVGSVQRLLCHALVTPLIVDRDGNPLFAGRTIRNANRQQRRALRAVYRTCAAAGCEVPFDQCEMHHIKWWERGGRTDLDNLLPLCARHHHVVHELGWRLELAPDRTLTVTDRRGQVVMVSTPDMPHPTRRAGRPSDQTAERRTGPARAVPNLLAS